MNDATLDRWKQRAAAAEENRRAMPIVTALVDECRAVFGQGCRIRYAKEGEREIGRPSPEGITVETSWLPEDKDRPKRVRAPKPEALDMWPTMARQGTGE